MTDILDKISIRLDNIEARVNAKGLTATHSSKKPR
jgi:hypothetical protein